MSNEAFEATAVPVPDCPACDREHVRGSEGCPARRIGTVFYGTYRIDRLLGCGGMGAVFAAWHQGLARKVALKLMLSSIARLPGIKERFLTEARRLAALDHPGIVRVHDTGEDAAGTPFIAMEMLHGESMETWIRQRPAVEAIIGVVGRALDALAEVHRAGIIHRDIKPDNIFIERRPDGTDRVVLLDFGVAGLDAGLAGDDRQTAHGTTLGTLAYMSPEQLSDATSVDRRADVFAVAASVFRAIAGRPPCEGSTQIEAMRNLATHQYLRSLRAAGVAVSPELDRVIARALDPDREQRPADAASFRAELEAAVRAPVVVAEPPIAHPISMPAREPAPRRALWVAGAVVAVAAVGIAIAVVASGGGSTPRTPSPGASGVSPPAADAARAVTPERSKLVRIAGRTFDDAVDRDAFLTWCGRAGEEHSVCAELFGRIEPAHVSVATFELDPTEVARRDFAPWLAAHGGSLASECAADAGYRPDAPASVAATCMSAVDAGRYCADRGLRLPTSAEWSLAAGVAERRVLPWGATEAPTCGTVVFGRTHADPVGPCADQPEGPAAVGESSLDVTPEGVHDLGGNVSEWVDVAPDVPSRDGKYLARGGSWAGFVIDMHPAKRQWLDPRSGPSGYTSVGFRCARDARDTKE